LEGLPRLRAIEKRDGDEEADEARKEEKYMTQRLI
jgi:hypothetical protein